MVIILAVSVSAQNRKSQGNTQAAPTNNKQAAVKAKPTASIDEIAKHKAKKDHPELFKEKDEFESTSDFQNRMEEKEALIKQLKEDLEKEKEEFRKQAVQNSIKELEHQKIEQISTYDADKGIFEVTVLGRMGTIAVPKESARLFKQNYKQANVTAMSQLDDNLEQTIITDIQIIDPNDSAVYPLEEIPEIGPEMVFVKGGTFQMGNNGNEGEGDEKPVHPVTLSDFYIGKYEVTQAEWEEIMGSNPSNFVSPNKPVEQVSWDDAQEFINKLSAATGRQYRLPTEAEWEFAARGGNKSQGYIYSGSNDPDDVAWYAGNTSNYTNEVGSKQPNELGIHDMSGNVWEWCNDLYDAAYYKNSPAKNPQGATKGSYRVFRGGSVINEYAVNCRSANRGRTDPGDKSYAYGFRVASSYKKTTKSR